MCGCAISLDQQQHDLCLPEPAVYAHCDAEHFFGSDVSVPVLNQRWCYLDQYRYDFGCEYSYHYVADGSYAVPGLCYL